MKFLAYANGEEAAGRIRELLEPKGIPVTVQEERLRVPFGPYGARFRLRVFVCLDSQFEDAVALVQDPRHVVAQPVNAERYHAWAAEQPVSNRLVWGAPLLLVATVVFLATVVYFVGVPSGT